MSVAWLVAAVIATCATYVIGLSAPDWTVWSACGSVFNHGLCVPAPGAAVAAQLALCFWIRTIRWSKVYGGVLLVLAALSGVVATDLARSFARNDVEWVVALALGITIILALSLVTVVILCHYDFTGHAASMTWLTLGALALIVMDTFFVEPSSVRVLVNALIAAICTGTLTQGLSVMFRVSRSPSRVALMASSQAYLSLLAVFYALAALIAAALTG
jgi:hypothetical protein